MTLFYLKTRRDLNSRLPIEPSLRVELRLEHPKCSVMNHYTIRVFFIRYFF